MDTNSGKTYKLVALLPMKGESERLKGKNFRSLAGKPLFRWILDTLLSIEEIDQVVINTDARYILEGHGIDRLDRVTIRPRSDELCGNRVSMNRIIADDISAVESQHFLMTHATNPLLTRGTILAALKVYQNALESGGGDSLFSVNRMQTRLYKKSGVPLNHDPVNLLRTQDLEPLYEENSCLYLFSPESFAKTNARIGERPVLFETPRLESQDIDDEATWCITEMIALAGLVADAAKRQKKQEGQPEVLDTYYDSTDLEEEDEFL